MVEVKSKKKTWHKVKAPKAWRPKDNQELIGTYLTCTIKKGQWGDYKCHQVKSKEEIFFITGAVADGLFDLVPEGSIVKVVYLGKKQSKTDTTKSYKDYELYTEQEIVVTKEL